MKIFIGLVAASWLLCSTAHAQRSTPTDDQLATPAQKQQRAADAQSVEAAQPPQSKASKHASRDTRANHTNSGHQPTDQRTTEQPSVAVDKAAQRAMRADKKRTRATME